MSIQLLLCVLPSAVLLAFWRQRRHPRLINNLAIRLVAGAGLAAAMIVVASVLVQSAWQIRPALTLPQVLLSTFFVPLLPLLALAHDKPHRGEHLPAAPAANKRLGYALYAGRRLAFPLLAAALAYANYLWFFERHHLSPRFLEPRLPLYQEATAVALLTLTLCWLTHVVFERASTHRHFITEHLLHNKRLPAALAASLLLIVLGVYIPGLQKLFNTAALDPADWLAALLAAAIFITTRLLQRHTRLHSRRAVLHLHRATHKLG